MRSAWGRLQSHHLRHKLHLWPRSNVCLSCRVWHQWTRERHLYGRWKVVVWDGKAELSGWALLSNHKHHNQVNHELTRRNLLCHSTTLAKKKEKKKKKKKKRPWIMHKSIHCSLSWDIEKSSLIARRCSDARNRATVPISWCIEVMIFWPHMILRDKEQCSDFYAQSKGPFFFFGQCSISSPLWTITFIWLSWHFDGICSSCHGSVFPTKGKFQSKLQNKSHQGPGMLTLCLSGRFMIYILCCGWIDHLHNYCLG